VYYWVVEQAATASDELHQPAAGVMVALVLLQVLSELLDALGEQCDLHFGRARIGVVEPVLADRGGLVGHLNESC
jgi:hypothetical protein